MSFFDNFKRGGKMPFGIQDLALAAIALALWLIFLFGANVAG